MADSRFFSNNGPFSLKELVAVLRNKGIESSIFPEENESFSVSDVSTLQDAQTGDISFLDNVKYKKYLEKSDASACILHPKHKDTASDKTTLLLTEEPYAAYAIIATHFYPESVNPVATPSETLIEPSASIADSATIMPGATIGQNAVIGENTTIHRNASIGDNVVIGDNCQIHPNATIQYSIIGNHVTIHSGCSIGQDGFGFATFQGQHITVPQLGRVMLEDHVNIGANCTIDRGAAGDTIIGAGTRLDNLVQIGHNVKTGKGCILVSHVGISGSTELGDYVVVGGQVGIAGHLKIGSFVQIAAQSGVVKDVEQGAKLCGSPAVPITQFHRQTHTLQQLTKKKKKG